MSLKDQRTLMVQWAENTLKAAAETKENLAKSKDKDSAASLGQQMFKKQQIEDNISAYHSGGGTQGSQLYLPPRYEHVKRGVVGPKPHFNRREK